MASTSPDKTSPNQERVRAFLAAVEANDLDRVLTLFAEDAVYHNIPVPPVQGTAAIRGVLHGFLRLASRFEWVVHQMAQTPGGVVLTERTDRFEIGGKWLALPVMGTFELPDGQITAWRDYCDTKQFQDQLAG